MRVCEGQGVEMCNGHELATTHPSRVVDGVAAGRRISCAACAGGLARTSTGSRAVMAAPRCRREDRAFGIAWLIMLVSLCKGLLRPRCSPCDAALYIHHHIRSIGLSMLFDASTVLPGAHPGADPRE